MKEKQYQPLVSIVIPVYNGSNYLKEAIESALDQTYKQIEILIINDGSRDEGKTEQIALSFGNKIRYYHKPNGGVATALNLGIREAQGEYISWLSHDDVYYPNKVEKQILHLNTLEKQDVVLYSNYDFIDKHSSFIKEVQIPYISPDDFIYNLIVGYPIHGCTALIPKRILEVMGYFNENLKTTQDYDLWYRIAKEFDFVCMSDRLIQSRLHEEQGTVTLSAIAVDECNDLLIRFIEDVSSIIIAKFSKNNNRLSFYWVAYQSFQKRNFTKAADYTEKKLKKAIWQKDILLNPVLWIAYLRYVFYLN